VSRKEFNRFTALATIETIGYSMFNKNRKASPFRTRSKFSRELLAFANFDMSLDSNIVDNCDAKPLSSQLSHNDNIFLNFIQTSGCVQDAFKISASLGRKATIREIASTLRIEVQYVN
jgi:hypothetical protein